MNIYAILDDINERKKEAIFAGVYGDKILKNEEALGLVLSILDHSHELSKLDLVEEMQKGGVSGDA